MVSTIAAQLSKGVSLNASLLADRSRRKETESYLFTNREASQHDFHSLHALGVNGLSKLKLLDSKFAKYEGNLFSDTARGLDRTLQSESQNAELDRTISMFFADLGPYLLEAPTSKALEWIVRRFRANEFNIDAIMALFLPYHETAHFTKMVSILHIKNSRLWSFLIPLKKAAKPLPRSMLIDEMVVNLDLARFVTSLLPEALEASQSYRTLTGFSASVTVDYVTRIKEVDVEVVAFLLPALTRSFAPDSNHDCTLASCICLATLSQYCRFSTQALGAILIEMIKSQRHMEKQRIIPFLVAVLGPQGPLETFPDALIDSIIALPNVDESLTESLLWVGAEKLISPLLPSLVMCASDARPGTILNSLIESPSMSGSLTEQLTRLLFKEVLQSTDQSHPVFKFLSLIYQRHGSIFSKVSSKLLDDMDVKDDRKNLERILQFVTAPLSGDDDSGKWLISCNSSDTSSRAIAVREILKTLAAGDVAAETLEDMYGALRARVLDVDVKVVETLYNDPTTVLPVFCNPSAIEIISTALAAPDISRSVMRLHFNFMAGELAGHSPELAHVIFELAYLPYLLFTKPRQKTATLVWQSLNNSNMAKYELLAGCLDLVFTQSAAAETFRSVEDMAALNLAVSTRIAGNIVASNAYASHIDMLIRQVTGSDPHTTCICYIILRSLLNQLSGEHQVNAAQRILSSMCIRSLDELHSVASNVTSLQEIISDEILSKAIVLKPNSPGTIHRLKLAILALLPIVQQPVDVKVNWLGAGATNSSDIRGDHFSELARSIYTLANSSSSAFQPISNSLLKALFINLREQSLLFLAGIWSSSVLSDEHSIDLPRVALFHAAAFLKAQMAEENNSQDFQVILPSLLIALRSKQRSVRLAAMDCIAIIAECTSSASASPTVYALDAVYGDSSDALQYLDWNDLGRFTSTLNMRREHFLNDSDYLGLHMQEILGKLRSDSKKEIGYKQRVLCYVLSHVSAWPFIPARVALLEILKNVSHKVKLQISLPLLQSIVPGDQPHLLWRDIEKSMDTQYIQLLLRLYDETAVADLNEPGSGSWVTIIRLIRSIFTDDTASLSLRGTMLQQIRKFFGSLTTELQREMYILLVQCSTLSLASHTTIKEASGPLLKNPTLIVALLAHFLPTSKENSSRASKRPKLTSDPEDTEATELSLRSMTVLVEILITLPMPGSVELMSSTLDALTQICHMHSSQPDINYLMQILMSMLEKVASSIAATTPLPPSSVRMEILVEILRVSDNPQTFNQALLLIASLARLAPEFVMQNVMPVFTFMGSNVFHRDDSYSFRVVQKTIDSIVPVVINSLKVKHPGSLGLQIASREFLRVFTDAATHIPRHRRTHFFNHLVEVLGQDEFTVSICLLLVDKVAHRIVRQKPSEIANALSLPLTILQSNFKTTPFKVIKELLEETSRLLDRTSKPDPLAGETFLELPQDEDETSTQKQIQAIIIFTDLVLQQSPRKSAESDENAIQISVQLLLGLANLETESTTSKQLVDVSRVSVKTLGHLLRVISAVEFTSTINTILRSSNLAVSNGAMNLLASRLANISPKIRQDISPTIIGIVEYIIAKMQMSQELSTFRAILFALRSIAQTADPREIPALTKCLPLVLRIASEQNTCTSDALGCLLPLSTKLGPRILPLFSHIVQFCSGVFHEASPIAPEDRSRLEQDAHSVLLSLLSSISQFWSVDELVRLGKLSLENRSTSLDLRKAMAKHIPAKQMLSALFRLWDAIQTSPASEREVFFDLFKRVLRIAPRDDIHDKLRNIFKLFLEAFDILQGPDREKLKTLETQILGTFLDVVVKLNEAAFKPLFRRLYDWAFNDSIGKRVDRIITFSRLMTALIKLLKSLVTPYMGVILTPLTELLETYRQDRKQSGNLWVSAIELFQISLSNDEGAFWRMDALRKLGSALVAQVEVCPSLEVNDARQIFKSCLNALTVAMDDDSSLKKLDLDLLMQTRSDDAQVRLFALECAESLWNGHGDKLSGFVTDVVTFIAECAEDEHDEVAKAARTLKRTVEKRCGSIDVLMQ